MAKKNTNIFTVIGASNHSDNEREENDYYATDPRALELLLEKEKFNDVIWEPAAGGHHLANVLMNNNYNVITSDIKCYDIQPNFIFNFLDANRELYEEICSTYSTSNTLAKTDILTNPPYKLALPFVKKALEIIDDGCHVIMFLRLAFLEGIERYFFFQENPPKKIYVLSNRFPCAKNGKFYETDKNGNEKKIGSAIAYAWFIWEKGFKGKPTIEWLIEHE